MIKFNRCLILHAERPRYMYVEMDSMDQNKCSLPWFKVNPKSVDTQVHVSTVVTNVRIPGRCCLDFLSNNTFPHDANLAVTCLHR